MCFITLHARPNRNAWTQRTAYKVLRLRNKELVSEHRKEFQWKPGAIHKAKGRPFQQLGAATAGIYVFKNYDDAFLYRNTLGNQPRMALTSRRAMGEPAQGAAGAETHA